MPDPDYISSIYRFTTPVMWAGVYHCNVEHVDIYQG